MIQASMHSSYICLGLLNNMLLNKLLIFRPDLDREVVKAEIQKMAEVSASTVSVHLKHCIRLAVEDVTNRMPWEE